MRSVLVVLAHPALHRSKANQKLVQAIQGLDRVEIHDLYETYPDFLIDIEAEQKRIIEFGALVFQHPLYWYSAPAMLKEWFDLVLAHGFAYGRDGVALSGKSWMQALTAGGSEHAYSPEGHNRFPLAELLRPIEATAHLCGCAWQEPFITYASRSGDPQALQAAALAYRDRIIALRDGAS